MFLDKPAIEQVGGQKAKNNTLSLLFGNSGKKRKKCRNSTLSCLGKWLSKYVSGVEEVTISRGGGREFGTKQIKRIFACKGNTHDMKMTL